MTEASFSVVGDLDVVEHRRDAVVLIDHGGAVILVHHGGRRGHLVPAAGRAEAVAADVDLGSQVEHGSGVMPGRLRRRDEPELGRVLRRPDEIREAADRILVGAVPGVRHDLRGDVAWPFI
jgi:hypothetical protein